MRGSCGPCLAPGDLCDGASGGGDLVVSGARSALPLAASGIGAMRLLKRRLNMIMRRDNSAVAFIGRVLGRAWPGSYLAALVPYLGTD